MRTNQIVCVSCALASVIATGTQLCIVVYQCYSSSRLTNTHAHEPTSSLCDFNDNGFDSEITRYSNVSCDVWVHTRWCDLVRSVLIITNHRTHTHCDFRLITDVVFVRNVIASIAPQLRHVSFDAHIPYYNEWVVDVDRWWDYYWCEPNCRQKCLLNRTQACSVCVALAIFVCIWTAFHT